MRLGVQVSILNCTYLNIFSSMGSGKSLSDMMPSCPSSMTAMGGVG
jgi:hypothetical protein